ncbi:hypothetical protein AAL_04736 [Moelleriella libera RCEF 2490]|uniref:Uncharacterized protein n=1 Tax=Moelleriella libera RCEF 2490 TaxID=1081109 RepID=A0A168BMV3_9HYPO|nr:hypothetical protein AAL_04736 [Moelleriella libera RCEF 2490]
MSSAGVATPPLGGEESLPLLATMNGDTPRQQRRRRPRPGPVLQRFRRGAVHALYASLTCSYSNVLLPCVPLGLLASGWGWPPAVIFALNFLAMLPLASILTFGTEQLAAIVGSVAGGLINATFGNAVEMITFLC